MRIDGPPKTEYEPSALDKAKMLADRARMAAEEAAIFDDDQTVLDKMKREAEAKRTAERMESRRRSQAYREADATKDLSEEGLNERGREEDYNYSVQFLEDPTSAQQAIEAYRANVKEVVIRVLDNPKDAEREFGPERVRHYRELARRMIEAFEPTKY